MNNSLPYLYQDSHQERVIKCVSPDLVKKFGHWENGNSYRHVAEGAGDIFRELTEDSPSAGYIREKVRRIERLLEDYFSGHLHRDDSYEFSRAENPGKYEEMLRQWVNQPVLTKEQDWAVRLNIQVVNGDYVKIRRQLLELDKRFL